MKEELIRVLNTKLDSVKVNIESLVELNKKIDDENEKLSYVNSILDIFRKDNHYDILNFTNLSKENFNNIIEIIGGNIKDMFGTSSCNYDGLIYLINGINNGVSLSLTLEQENAINYFLQGVEGKCEEYEAVVDGLLLVKDHFEISDVAVLNEKRDNYEHILDKMKEEEYVEEIDDIMEAINFSKIEPEKVIDMLSYLLEYNADVYKKNQNSLPVQDDVIEPIVPDTPLDVKEEHEEDNVPEFEEPKETVENEVNKEYDEFHFPEFENIKIDEVEEKQEEAITPNVEEEKTENMFTPLEVSTENEKVEPLPVVDPLPMPEINSVVPEVNTINVPTVDNENSDFEGIVNEDDYEEYNVADETVNDNSVDDATSTREIQRLLKEYDIKNLDNNLNQLLYGNIENYRKVLSFLKNNDLINEFAKNEELLINVLTCSTDEDLQDIVNIIKNELSVDDEDYKMTLKISVNTIPSIFIREGGNYENFARNVKLFKEMGINLVSLFDFSKEVFVANHHNLLRNYNIIKKYNINLDYKNIKYLLLLPNVEEKIDLYVESEYPDRTKNNEKFDGILYINSYPSKLNVVAPETIKRLRYSSENSKKVFGSKANSLAGEITNLKVNVIDIPSSYMDRFFDNKFEKLTSDEVREYIKLCRSSSNVSDFVNELDILEKYHNGLRYTINNINISYNKVTRNYNILRSYGIDKNKALLFAVFYNLVITNDEARMLNEILERDGE